MISGRATWLGESKCVNPSKCFVGFDRLSSISSEKSLRFSYLTEVNYQPVRKKEITLGHTPKAALLSD